MKKASEVFKEQYPYIRLWGQYAHHDESVTEETIKLAHEQKPPSDVMFKFNVMNEGRWFTLSELPNPHPFRDFVRESNKARN